MADYERTFTPNDQGHNWVSLGALDPGATTLRELVVREYDHATNTITGPFDFTSWSDPQISFFSSNPKKSIIGYGTLGLIPCTFTSDKTDGTVRFEIGKRSIALFRALGEFRPGFQLGVVNPEGKRIIKARGSAFLAQGAND